MIYVKALLNRQLPRNEKSVGKTIKVVLDYEVWKPFFMKKNYFYRLKEKLSIKKIDSEQPKGAWFFVITLNIIGFIGYFILNSYGINLSK